MASVVATSRPAAPQPTDGALDARVEGEVAAQRHLGGTHDVDEMVQLTGRVDERVDPGAPQQLLGGVRVRPA